MTADPSHDENAKLCLETLRLLDRDRYLACLLAPEEHRAALAALYAFNAEIAKIRDVVRDALPGEVRLQYWRDLLEDRAHGSTAANPVASTLIATIAKYDLPRKPLLDMIEARIFDLYDDPMPNRTALEGYAGETASALLQLSSLVLSPKEAAEFADTAGHAGVAQAVAGLILLMPIHSRRGQVYIPGDILEAVGLTREQFLTREEPAKVAAAIDAFAGLGKEHLRRARAKLPPSQLFPVYAPLSLAAGVLKRAQKEKNAIFDKSIALPQWRRQLRMAISIGLKRF